MDLFCFVVSILLGVSAGGQMAGGKEGPGSTLMIAASICLLASAIASKSGKSERPGAKKAELDER
jgi:hypothetical protein